MPTEAAPARLRPAWRHPRSRRRRPVRGVAFRKGVILWACKEAQDAQDEAVLDEWLSEALVKRSSMSGWQTRGSAAAHDDVGKWLDPDWILRAEAVTFEPVNHQAPP